MHLAVKEYEKALFCFQAVSLRHILSIQNLYRVKNENPLRDDFRGTILVIVPKKITKEISM